MRIIRNFINTASIAGLDTSCVANVKRPPFFMTPAGPDPGGPKEPSPHKPDANSGKGQGG
jgi:hypothetical protein